MAYSDFKLNELLKTFNLTLREKSDIFASVSSSTCSEYLEFTLDQNVELAVAINTEKARSELIIAPILLEVRRILQNQISLFSGVDFTVDSDRGLNGICDFVISQSSEQLLILAPVITIVEAKNENLKSGFAQCIAEMVAAQIFNKQENNPIEKIYGVVTIGTIWRFLELDGKTISIDLSEHYISDINQILGILVYMARSLKF
ncbi:MAG: hypothetical protein KME18_23200 [Phormidium tanganyikae FI6-MK23]|jgi:hypothetical protein|nr:hypothetical protein [Phormidium tanganyikae FI6-MK23]